MLNITMLLLFSAIVWQMHYVWLILPMAMMMVNLLDYPVKPFFFTLTVVVALISAQAREQRFFHSLNLVGGALLFYSLAILILRPDLVVLRPSQAKASEDQAV